MGREAMQPVELANEPSDMAQVAATGSDVATGPAVARRWARRRRWALAVAATVVVGLVGTQALLDARERARLAHVAAVPGVLAPVDASIGALWTTSDAAALSALQGGTVGDLGVGGYVDRLGRRSAEAVRARTGQVVWSTVLNGPTATAPASFDGVPLCSTTDPSVTPRRLLCLVNDGMSGRSDDGSRTTVPSTSARLVVLDPATGQQQAERTVPTSASREVGVLAGLAVVASRSDDDHLVVTAAEPLTGTVHWRFESPEPLAPALPYGTETDPSGISVSVVAGRVAVRTSGGELWVFSGTGAVQSHAVTDRASELQEPRPGLLAVVASATPRAPGTSTTLLGRDGKTGASFDERPLQLAVDDGTVPGLLFTVGDQLHAWDATTGTLVWTSTDRVDDTAALLGLGVDRSAVLLDGRLFVMGVGRRLLALDAATGAPRWEQRIAQGASSQIFTDGSALLVSQVRSGLTLTLVAFDPVDGHRLWAAPLPSSVAYLSQAGRQLVGSSRDSGSTAVLG